MPNKIKNVFVSHHHKDDSSVDGLTNMVSKKGYHLRNSSIRVKPENQKRIDQKQISDNTIKRLLRMKMRWASQLIVVIGKETHTRPWVNWEIEAAHKLGMPIIGVYENGLKDQVEIPDKLKEHGTARVGWTADSVIDALNGNSPFQNPDGTPCPKVDGGNAVC
jgi:antiphage defense system Thoeris ThsB-like protein